MTVGVGLVSAHSENGEIEEGGKEGEEEVRAGAKRCDERSDEQKVVSYSAMQ